MSTPRTIDEDARKFETWLNRETSCGGGTPGMYAAYIKRLDTPIDLNQMTLEEIIAVLEDAVTTPAVRSAFKKYLAYIKQTADLDIGQRRDVAFLRDEISDIQLKESTPLDKSEVLRKYLRRTEIQDLVNHVKHDLTPGDFNGNPQWYDEFRILPLLMFETGCRISEVIGKQNDPDHTGLRRADIDFEDNKVRIRNAKGGKGRFTHFHDVAPLLQSHVDQYGIQTGKVFHIPYWKQNYYFKRAGKILFGFPGPNEPTAENEHRLTAHWMRHSFATNWVIKKYQETGRWAEAKELVHNYLDHDQMATTEAYIGAAKELEQDNIFDESGGFGIEV
ncbi:site-specific integrase [Halogeometricum borinquense]|uniref:Site-specific integrase n=1 Tax=Halogeometricum borinquense TaxID=60847 RepID=A0A6C0UIF9_9EURY|nr:site-specific integrase [Halogeometricum borinquense]QIB75354.1 site-specific integrase [Halogeometricum borinquense]